MKSFFNQYFWYGLIFILSLISLFFLPMLGTEIGLAWTLPNTSIGWIVWTISNLTASVLNVLMFHSFIKQGKLNILEHPSYQEATNLLKENQIGKIENPRSPQVWAKKQYTNKGVSLALFTFLGTISFGHAILTFNLVKFLAQLITLLFGLIFGFMQMKSTEEYWTIEYLEYAKFAIKEKKNNVSTQQHNLQEFGRASSEQSTEDSGTV